jgi:nucleoside-diphosphate-sugar epimerase
MGTEPDLHVVLGATGGIGSALVHELVARDHAVRAVHRDGGHVPNRVERVRADLNDPDDARIVCRDAAVVYHCAQPEPGRWLEDFPVMTFNILEAAASAGARLVYVDDCLVYGRVHGFITEKTEPRKVGPRGRLRHTIAEQLLAAHRTGRLPVTIGRCSDYYGPNGTGSVTGTMLFARVAKGLRPRWTGRLDVPHTLHYLDDAAIGLITLATRPEAAGQVWHLPAAEPLTGREFLDILNSELRGATRPTDARRQLGRLAAALSMSNHQQHLSEALVQFQAPFVASFEKYQRVFGPALTTPHSKAIAETLAWFRIFRGR